MLSSLTTRPSVTASHLLRRTAFPVAFPLTSRRMFALTPYRADQAKTLQFQKQLPRLPIPALQPSFDRYLKSLKPLLLQQALEKGVEDERGQLEFVEMETKKREEWVKDFLKQGGLGRTLQERLKDVDRSTPDNWLDDAFWIKAAYHSWRVPLPVNSNWWILMADDTAIPESVRTSIPPQGEFTDWQIKRAAKLVERLMLFKVRLDRQEILPDSSRAGPFCMHQYTRVFGVNRTPNLPTDNLVHSPFPHPAKHIIVIANDHFYKFEVVQPNGDVKPLDELESKLWQIADDAKSQARGEGVGVLSADNRDTWAGSREQLLSLDPINRASLTTIEDSLFCLSLDDRTVKSEHYTTSSPDTPTPDLDAHILNASHSNGQGLNRWWDKAVSIHVESSGRAAMVGEHSPCDALIPSIVAEYVLAESVTEGPSVRGREIGEQGGIEKLKWSLDSKAKENIQKAIKTVEGIAADSDGKMLWYDEYGVEWIKKVGKHSPDAYLQMALQLAYHKTHNVPVATYETASTRLYRHGRTDVIRTLSEDSWRWVQAMRTDSKSDPKKLYALLTAATKAHNTYTRDSSTGKGCDRHFMGLRLLMREGESHAIFDDELFGESQSWVLSTSGLSAGDRFWGTGFGTVWPNGYGINYLAGNKVIKFGIESKRSCAETSTDVFRKNLTEAMREMREVCEKGQEAEPATTPAAKL